MEHKAGVVRVRLKVITRMGRLWLWLAVTAVTWGVTADCQAAAGVQQWEKLIEQRQQAAEALPLADEQYRTALAGASDSLRDLMTSYPDHPRQPIWQTDLAAMLLVDKLQTVERYAPQFFELGVASAEQLRAFEQDTSEAYRLLEEAEQMWRTRRINGLRLSNTEREEWQTYRVVRTPYYLAMAAYGQAVLAARHENGTDAAWARQRWQQVIEITEPFAATPQSGIQRQAGLLWAKAADRLGDTQAALRKLASIDEGTIADVLDLEIRLVRAKLLYQQGQADTAMLFLKQLQQEPMVRKSALDRLLVTDLIHRLMADAAAGLTDDEHRAMAIEAAYEPYLQLLTDPALGGASESLRWYVYRRWMLMPQITVGLRERPALVRLAVAETWLKTVTDELKGKTPAAPAAEQRRRLAAASELAGTLADPGLAANIQARGRLTVALAQYWEQPDDSANLLAVAEALTAVADHWPGQPVSERAARAAVGVLRVLIRDVGDEPGVIEAYRTLMRVLLTKFPMLAVTDDQRMYFAQTVLIPAEQWDQVRAILEELPATHRDYFRARSLQLQVMHHHSQAPRQAVARQAGYLRLEAEAGLDADDTQVRQDARHALAVTQLTLAELAMEHHAPAEAIEAVAGFAQQFPQEESLLLRAMTVQVRAQAARGELERAAESAAAMMQRFPRDGVSVINEVLQDIELKIDDLQEQQLAASSDTTQKKLGEQVAELAAGARRFSQLLVQWAQGQSLSQAQMLSLEVSLARSWRLSGQPERAVQQLKPWLQTHGDEAALLNEYAESLFAVGSEGALVEAARYYDRLITGMEPPHPPMWWNAWVHRLQINDRLRQETDVIPLRVRQLMLTDPQLGGPRFAKPLTELKAKYE